MSDWIPPYLHPEGERVSEEQLQRERTAERRRARQDYERATLLLLLGTITLGIGAAFAVLVGVQASPPALLYEFGLIAMAFGFLATWILGIVLSASSRRYLWLVLMIFPPTAVPAAVAYAVIRRGEAKATLSVL